MELISIRDLKRYALKNDKDNIGRTFLYVTDDSIIGYFTLANGSIVHDELFITNNRLPRYPIPITLLARLAVDIRHQKKHIGKFLVQKAIGIAYDNSFSVGSYGVAVDVKSEAKGFYEHIGFSLISKDNVYLYPFALIEKRRILASNKTVF